MDSPTAAGLAARYDGVRRKSDRTEIDADRFDRGVARGDAGAWGVGALVVDGSRALFVREGETWLLPGGRLDPGERPAAGAARETYEETGVAVDVTGLGAVAEQTFVREGGDESFEFAFATFLAEPISDPEATAPGPDVDGVAWRDSVPENTFDRDLVVDLLTERSNRSAGPDGA